MGAVAPGNGRVTIGVVALGVKPRLRSMLEALLRHDSATEFDVVCVVNAAEPDDAALAALPDGVRVVARRGNLGYTGGLHVARAHAHGEFLVWGQDDMTPQPGWLDALVAAAEDHPTAGFVAPCQVLEDGSVQPLQRGHTPPGGDPSQWPACVDEAPAAPEGPATVHGWVSGTGALTPLAVWDAVGGVDLHLWPLSMVDLQYSVHVRAHGFEVLHAPSAPLLHPRRGSTTPFLALYCAVRNSAWLTPRWSEPTLVLGERDAVAAAHPCAPWLGENGDAIERWQLDLASQAYLPLMREADEASTSADVLRRERATTEAVYASTSWKVTRPLRAASRLARMLRGG